MNRILLILLMLLSLPQLNAQQQKLKYREVISFTTSRYDHLETIYSDDLKHENESLIRKKIQYTVLEVKEDFYWIEATVQLIGSYSRIKLYPNLNWETNSWNYPELESTIKRFDSNKDYYKVKFKLYNDGSYSNVSLLGFNVGNDAKHDAKVLSLFNMDFVCPMICFSGDLNKNKEVKYGKDILQVKASNEEYIFLQNNEGKVDPEDLISYKFDRKTGYLLEKQLSTGNSYKTSEYKENRKSLETIKLVNVSYNPYSCYMDANKKEKVDTTLRKTNVTIRGRIINPSDKHDVSLIWSKLGKGQEIITKLDSLGQFELRMYLDDVQKVQFKHKEIASLMLSPGDDLFITVDVNQFDESIRATGVGSNNANYFFDAFLFQEKKKLFTESLWLNEDEISSYTYEKYKSMVKAFVNKRLGFLNGYKNKLSPEIYLAEYYEPILMGVKRVNEFPFRLASLKKGVPFEKVKKKYVNELDDLIHMDNDMMMFSEHYDWFMEYAGHRFIDRKINKIVGRGKLNKPKSTEDYDDYISSYNVNHKYFSGVTQHVLKYQLIKNALRKAEPETYSKLYKRFIKEFPNSLRSQDLKSQFKLTEKAQVGDKAFDFELLDHEGNVVRLSDYTGKAIYLSFTNVRNKISPKRLKEYNKNLSSIFKDTNTVLIFISLYHTDEETSLLDGIEGVKLFAKIDQSEELVKNFYFRSIDRNMIIDVNGNIFNRNAPDLSGIIKEPHVLLNAANVPKPVDEAKTILVLKWISVIVVILLLISIVVWVIYRRRTQKRIQEESIKTKVRELELTAIRAQMNPHFMYNCLNSIQNLVQKKQSDEAHQYLSKFADLIRSVLKNSEKEEISLATELEIIGNYVELEKLRFDIDFKVEMDESVDSYSVFIPPLILQPLVENAILHGLVPKQGERTLQVKIVRNTKNNICVSISDNGVGRNTSAEKPKSSNGKGIKFSQERLDLLAEKYGTEYHMQINDLKDESGKALGTQVQICFSEE